MRLLIWITCLVIGTGVLRAQEARISEGNRPESEVAAAANPTDPNNLVIAAVNDFSPASGTSGSRISVYFSQDQGAEWTQSSFDAQLPGVTGAFTADPSLAFDANGIAYLTYLVWISTPTGIDARLYVARSTDGGVQWTTELIESRTDALLDKPWVVSDLNPTSPRYGTVYLTYVLATGNFGNVLRVQVRRLSPGASSFSGPTPVADDNTYYYQQAPTVCVDRTGRLYVGFKASTNGGIGYYSVHSPDGGQTFSDPSRIVYFNFYLNDFNIIPTLDRVGLDRLYPCPQLAVDHTDGPYSGRVYASWTNKEEGVIAYGLDALLSYSDNQGASWSTPRRIHSDEVDRRNQYYATLTVADNGHLLSSWYDRREDSNNRITHYYYARSTDGGATFTDEQPLTSQPSDFGDIHLKNDGFGIGEYTDLVTVGNRAFAFWADGRTNNGDVRLYNARIDFGPTSSRVGPDRYLTHVDWWVTNPVRETATVGLTLDRPLSFKWEWYTLSGRQLAVRPVTVLPAGTHQLSLPLPAAAPGPLVLRLRTAAGSQGKLVWVE